MNEYILTDIMLLIGSFLVGIIIASPIAYKLGKRAVLNSALVMIKERTPPMTHDRSKATVRRFPIQVNADKNASIPS